MRRHVREVKKVAEALVESGEIEDFRFDSGNKHNKLSFKVRGGWHSVPFATSPSTPYSDNATRQCVRRVIRSLSPAVCSNANEVRNK